MCCAERPWMFAADIYSCGAGSDDNTATGVIARLLSGGGLETQQGRVLYTDNFYTSLGLAINVWISHGMYIVGTHRLTKKKSRTLVGEGCACIIMTVCVCVWRRAGVTVMIVYMREHPYASSLG